MLITQLYTIRCTHRLARQAEFPYYNVQNNEIVQQTQAAIFLHFFLFFLHFFLKKRKVYTSLHAWKRRAVDQS